MSDWFPISHGYWTRHIPGVGAYEIADMGKLGVRRAFRPDAGGDWEIEFFETVEGARQVPDALAELER